MNSDPTGASLNPLAFLRRHERKLIAAWLLACVGFLALIYGWGIRRRAVDRAVTFLNRSWIERLEIAEEIVADGRYEEAAVAIERLDRSLPVTWVKHRDNLHRERLLELLGTTQAELGRKRRSLEAFTRLVEFDPRNWKNHFQLGEVCRRFGEFEQAQAAYRAALALHPSHLGSVAALIRMAFEAGRYAEVPPLYEDYLDSYLLAPGTLRLGRAEVALELPVDGREHEIDLPINVEAGWGGELCLDTAGYSLRLGALELVRPLRVGEPRTPDRLLVESDRGWRGEGVVSLGDGGWSAREPTSSLCRGVPDPGVSRIRLRLTAFKAVFPDTWQLVERSYRNLLDDEGLAAARARSIVGGYPEADARFWPVKRRPASREQ